VLSDITSQFFWRRVMTSEVDLEMRRHFERKLRMIRALARQANDGVYGSEPELLTAALQAIIDDSFEELPIEPDPSAFKDFGSW